MPIGLKVDRHVELCGHVVHVLDARLGQAHRHAERADILTRCAVGVRRLHDHSAQRGLERERRELLAHEGSKERRDLVAVEQAPLGALPVVEDDAVGVAVDGASAHRRCRRRLEPARRLASLLDVLGTAALVERAVAHAVD